ncbi:MAG: hypothetical protein LUH21_03945 [Clostridiales bacterium]|nr:hypothetical protein [Clostridiales bacterium]
MECLIKDDLPIYRGNDFIVNDKITIHQCTLDEICTYGEYNYFALINTLTAVGADMKFQLFDAGIDYTKISDYQLFYSFLCRGISQEQSSIILGTLDFSKFEILSRQDTGDLVLYDKSDNIIIDEYTYLLIVEVLRKMHGLKRNNQIPANESTKQALIEDARDEYIANINKRHTSQLKNMISTMINSEGFKYNHDEVWNMKINAFLDSVKRINKIKDAGLLLQSGYSGYGVNLKDIPNKRLDWLGELE